MKKRSWIYGYSRRGQAGQGMVEYALLLALIAIAVIGAVVALSGAVGQAFNTTTNDISTSKPSEIVLTPAPTISSGVTNSDTSAYVIAYVPMFADSTWEN